jgi:DNA-binding PadR family transcriptional regulator
VVNRRYAILGLLIEEPDYGYRLTERVQTRSGITIGRTYTYDLLKGLEKAKLIRRYREERAANGSVRVYFAATELGVAEFDKWMGASAKIRPMYEELQIKVAFSREADLPGLIPLLQWRERECLTALRLHRSESAKRGLAELDGWARSAAVCVRNADIEYLEVMVSWLQATRAVMERTVEEGRRRRRG